MPPIAGCQNRSKLAHRRYHYSHLAKRYSQALDSPSRRFDPLPCRSVCIRGFKIPLLVRVATESHRKARKQAPGSSRRARGSARSTADQVPRRDRAGVRSRQTSNAEQVFQQVRNSRVVPPAERARRPLCYAYLFHFNLRLVRAAWFFEASADGDPFWFNVSHLRPR